MLYLLDMNTTTASQKMTIFFAEEIPQIGHNQFDKPRRFPVIIKDGLWTAFILSGPKGQRARFGYLVEIQRETLHDLEVVLYGDHAMILGKVDNLEFKFVVETDDEADLLKLRYPEHYALCQFHIN